MIKLPDKNAASKIRVCDLKEGDVAVVTFPAYGTQLLYVFRSTEGSPRSMVSLSTPTLHWTNITKSHIEVDRILQHGETLTIK